MKLTLKFIFVFLFLFISGNHVYAQAPSLSVTPMSQCPNSNNTYTIDMGYFQPVQGATSYSWSIISSNSCVATYTNGQHWTGINAALSGSQIAISTTCCGQFTATCYPYSGNVLINTSVISLTFNIECAPNGPVVVSNSAICLGQNVSFSSAVNAPASTFTWSTPNGPVMANPVTFFPSFNTCLTYTVTTPQGCSYTPISAGCVSVQVALSTASPASQTICPGLPICFSLVPQSNVTTNVLPSAITAASWFSPGNVPMSTSCISSAVAGTYSAILTHTGAAGTCTLASPVSVSTGTSLTIFASASSASVCSGVAVQLTASSNQTAALNYTWTIPNTPITNITQIGNSIIHTNSLATASSPQVYMVNTNYLGCPGTGTVAVGLLSLTPTLFPSSYSICPGTAMQFIVSGGLGTLDSLYGPPGNPPGTLIGSTIAGPSLALFTFTPSTLTNLPHIYTLHADSAGCKGTATISIGKFDLSPRLNIAASSLSICPSTPVTYSASMSSGILSSFNYTFVDQFISTLNQFSAGVASVQPILLPQSYAVLVDSSTCHGSASITINEFVLKPSIVASNTLICRNTAVSLTCQSGPYVSSNSYTFGTLSPIIGVIPSANGSFSFTTHSPFVQTVYTVRMDSLGCKNDLQNLPTVTVSLKPDLVLNTSATIASVCPGTAATLAVNSLSNSTGPVTYTWTQASGTGSISAPINSQSVQVFPFTNSSYSVFARDTFGCVGNTVSTVVVNASIGFPILLSASQLSICNGESLKLTATSTITTLGNSTLSYTWLPLSIGSSSVNSLTVTPLAGTMYSVIAANPYGCVAQAFLAVGVDACLGLERLHEDELQFHLFPNPASELIVIEVARSCQIKVYSLNGRLVMAKSLEAGQSTLDSSSFNAGCYVMEIIAEGKITHTKFIIQ